MIKLSTAGIGPNIIINDSSMKPTKYYTSVYLRFISYDRFLFRFADREDMLNPPPELVERVRNCMIYLICSRPIVTMVPGSLKKQDDDYHVEIKYRINDKENQITAKCPPEIIVDLGGRIEISGYPHTSIHSYDKEGNLVVDTLISNMVHLLDGLPEEISNHEVLYIGKGTADCAVDRLSGHSMLERILADVLKNEPNKEVAILIYNFEIKKSAMQIPEIGEQAEIRGDLAKTHFLKVKEYKPDLDEQTKIAEALLIDYFSTSVYNTHFANGLSLNAGIFNNVREVDFDAFVIELDNENIGYLKIFSKKIAPDYYHHAWMDIRKLEGRVSVFDPTTQISI